MASAQDVSEWGLWDGPRRQRPPPDMSQPYDNGRFDRRSRDSDDDVYELPGRRPYTDRGDDDDRGYDVRRDDNRRYDDREDEDRRERGPALETEAEQDKAPGVDGGPRPDIQPSAPAVVAFSAAYAPGSIVIDTGQRKLYYVRGPMSAFAYPIGVGREGFAWTGSEKVSRVTDWPDWYPPAEMRQRKPELPERMLGGLRNPLGVKAIYLGTTLYRIHGTNDPKSIGKAESSGCFRMLNEHVLHLAALVQIGTPVTVVRSLNRSTVAVATPPAPRLKQRLSPRLSQSAPRPRWSDRYYERDWDER